MDAEELKRWAQRRAGGGEGSRGGNIVGHTRRGKPIYGPASGGTGEPRLPNIHSAVSLRKYAAARADEQGKNHKYSIEDHQDAAKAHAKAAKSAPFRRAAIHDAMETAHLLHAKRGAEQEERDLGEHFSKKTERTGK